MRRRNHGLGSENHRATPTEERHSARFDCDFISEVISISQKRVLFQVVCTYNRGVQRPKTLLRYTEDFKPRTELNRAVELGIIAPNFKFQPCTKYRDSVQQVLGIANVQRTTRTTSRVGRATCSTPEEYKRSIIRC